MRSIEIHPHTLNGVRVYSIKRDGAFREVCLRQAEALRVLVSLYGADNARALAALDTARLDYLNRPQIVVAEAEAA